MIGWLDDWMTGWRADAHAWSSEWNFTLGVNASDTVNASSGNATSGQSAEGDGVVPMDVGEGDGLVANGTAWGDGGDALKNASTNATGDAPPVDERWGLLRNSKFAEWKVEAERDALHAAATAVLNPRPVVERYPLFCRASADARLQRYPNPLSASPHPDPSCHVPSLRNRS